MKVERVFANDSKHTVEDLFQEFVSAQIDTIVGNYNKNNSNKEKQHDDSKKKVA